MERIALIFAFLFVATTGQTVTFGDLKDQIVDQTYVTITESGGPATMYDFTEGRSASLRVGVISHVLTNRFLNADLGWFGGTDGHVDGIFIGGPSIRLDSAFAYYFPNVSDKVTMFIPKAIQKLYLGAGCGWATDNGSFHYSGFLGYNF